MAFDEPTVVVGRITRAHGVRGEVAVLVLTEVAERFEPGRVVYLEDGRALTIAHVRPHRGRLLVTFEEIPDRNAAEASRGLVLSVTVDPTELPDDPEEFYDHQLVGLAVESPDGDRLGTVTRVEHAGAQDLLVIDVDGRSVLFPFVRALVPVVDVAAGKVVVDDRPGLLGEEAP